MCVMDLLKRKKEFDIPGSVYVSEDIAAGEMFTEANLRIVRPGHGAPPWLIDHLLGQIARRDYQAGTALSFDQLF